jgi:hypothetical protein
MSKLFSLSFAIMLTVSKAKQCLNSVVLTGTSTQEECYDSIKLDRDTFGCTGNTYQYNSVTSQCACATDLCTLKTTGADWQIYRQANLNHTYTCECAAGFTGTNCEEDIDECNTIPTTSYVTHARSDDASFGTSDEFSSSCSDVCAAQTSVCNEQMYTDILGPSQGLTGVARSRCQIQVDVFLPLYGVDVGGTLIADGSVQAQTNPVDWICSKCVLYPAGETVRAQSTNPDCLPGVYYGENPSDNTLTQNIFFWNAALDQNGYDCDFKASDLVKNIMCSCTTVSPCQNAATCTETSDGTTLMPGVYHCDCPTGYNGTNCEEDINECDPDPCQNGGTCTETSDGTTLTPGVYHCECADGYTGTNCEEDINECALPASTCTSQMTTRCNAAGTCFNPSGCSDRDMSTGVWGGGNTFCNNGFYSDCDNCYTTSSCYRPQTPCQNGAVCTETSDGTTLTPGVYHCECPTGYNGTNCDEDINECDPDPCQNGGACLTVDDSYMCACPPGYSGTNCEIDTNECDPDPCQNGATCTETSDGTTLTVGVYHCACPTGFTGSDCETTTPCDPDPCQNSALCTVVQDGNGVQSAVCTCAEGYSGTNCEIDTNECDPDPCQNSGVCTETSDGITPTVGMYHCECVAGFTDYACHISIPCAATPCQNGATCSESIVTDPPPTYNVIAHQSTCSSYADGYRGLTADECENVPNTVSMTVYGDGLGIHTYGACAYNGMGGTMLGVIDDSQPDLCFFSTCACIKPSVEFTCTCLPGYNGTLCDEDINECDPDPCQNGGTCSETTDGTTAALGVYHCECPAGHSGTNCEIIEDPCLSATCNDGECLSSIIMQPYNTFVQDVDTTIAL